MKLIMIFDNFSGMVMRSQCMYKFDEYCDIMKQLEKEWRSINIVDRINAFTAVDESIKETKTKHSNLTIWNFFFLK